MHDPSSTGAGGGPAALYNLRFDRAGLRQECGAAVSIVERMKAESPDLRDWINFPLMNESGRTDDYRLVQSNRSGTYTDHASRFPHCREIVEVFRARSMVVTDARIAVLYERGIFRPHTDSYDSSRFLIPLNEQETDFRHIVDPTCFLMRAGELWWIDGHCRHGAANVRDRGKRVMLLIDVSRDSPRSALGPSRPIPSDHLCPRMPWTEEARAAIFEHLRPVVGSWSFDDVERELLMIPFLYDLDVARSYAEIEAFCRLVANDPAPPVVRAHYTKLAEALQKPPLPFQVAASGFISPTEPLLGGNDAVTPPEAAERADRRSAEPFEEA
jgi:Aspartyl/Asparaginyl beta-hydroxylase